MKDGLDGKIMTKFFGLRAKTYSYLVDDGSEDKKTKDLKMPVIKIKLKFENYKNCWKQLNLEIKQIIKNKMKLT